jgi:hypothetical protein
MTTVLQFKTRARALFQERVERMVLETDLIDWINAGVRDFSSRVHWYERIAAMAVVAYKEQYALPTDILKLMMARWLGKYRIEAVDRSKWAASTFFTGNPVGIPSVALLSPHDSIIRFYPAPSISSPTTTLTGEAGIDASVTTIPVASTASFAGSGWILIENEQIWFGNKDATNFLLCRRGDGGTTAATHSGGTLVTEGTITLDTCAIPAAITADGNIVNMPVAFEDTLVDYLASFGWAAKQDHKKAAYHMARYEKRREEAALEKFWNMQDGSPAVKDETYDMGWYGQS